MMELESWFKHGVCQLSSVVHEIGCKSNGHQVDGRVISGGRRKFPMVRM